MTKKQEHEEFIDKLQKLFVKYGGSILTYNYEGSIMITTKKDGVETKTMFDFCVIDKDLREEIAKEENDD